tara:strand:+ start:3724 stop:4038 length:315 start_codon:yes stop_codon:yes gene_type:complete
MDKKITMTISLPFLDAKSATREEKEACPTAPLFTDEQVAVRWSFCGSAPVAVFTGTCYEKDKVALECVLREAVLSFEKEVNTKLDTLKKTAFYRNHNVTQLIAS